MNLLKFTLSVAIVSLAIQAETTPVLAPGKVERARQLLDLRPRMPEAGPLVTRGALSADQHEKLQSISGEAREKLGEPMPRLVTFSWSDQAETAPSVQLAQVERSRQTQEQAPRVPAVGPLVRSQGQGLTDDQREKLRSINEKAREEQQDVRKQLQAARSELERLVRAEEVDEPAIRKQAEAIGKLEGDLAILRARQSAMYRDAGLPQMRSTTPAIPSRTIKRSELPQPGAAVPPRLQQRLEQVVRRPSPTNAPARKAE